MGVSLGKALRKGTKEVSKCHKFFENAARAGASVKKDRSKLGTTELQPFRSPRRWWLDVHVADSQRSLLLHSTRLRVKIFVVILTRSRPLARPKGFPIHVALLPQAPFALRRELAEQATSTSTRHGILVAGRIGRFRFQTRDIRRFFLRNCGSRSSRCHDTKCNRD